MLAHRLRFAEDARARVLLDLIRTFRASFYWPADNSGDPEAYNQAVGVQNKQHVERYTASRK